MTTFEELQFNWCISADDFIESLKDLSPREKKILELRFGIKDGITRTLLDVAKEFGVTRERIRQIEAKALDRMRYITNKGNTYKADLENQ